MTSAPPPRAVPASAVEAYEDLRKAAVEGLRPGALATLRFHGLLEGLPLLVVKKAAASAPVLRRPAIVDPPPPADEFVRLLANLVLSTHSEEVTHVY